MFLFIRLHSRHRVRHLDFLLVSITAVAAVAVAVGRVLYRETREKNNKRRLSVHRLFCFGLCSSSSLVNKQQFSFPCSPSEFLLLQDFQALLYLVILRLHGQRGARRFLFQFAETSLEIFDFVGQNRGGVQR